MAAPVIDSRNDFQVSNDADHSYNFSLTNTPPAGGVIVVLASVYTGASDGQATTLTATGGSGITITERVNTIGTSQFNIGVGIWTVEYSTAPTSLTILRSGATGGQFYASGSAINLTGQTGSYLDVAGSSTGTGTNVDATGLPDLTDANDIVLGVMTRNTADSTTVTPDSPWTEVVEIGEDNSVYQTCNIIQYTPGSTGAHDPAWTLSASDTWEAGGIAIKGTASGGVSLKGRKTLLGVGL